MTYLTCKLANFDAIKFILSKIGEKPLRFLIFVSILLSAGAFAFAVLVTNLNSIDLFRPIPNCTTMTNEIINSTSNDVTLLFADKISQGLEISISSLRSTGSKCKIILFLPSDIRLYSKHKEFFKDNQVEIIYFEKNPNFVPHLDRYIHEYEYMKRNINRINRILHADSFDTFFQSDPFKHISSDKLHFFGEGFPIKSCKWNKNWISSCYGDEALKSVWKNEILCSGTIAGNSQLYLSFLKILIESVEFKKCHFHSLDQGILNFLVYNGNLSSSNISYSIESCDSFVLTMSRCMFAKNIYFINDSFFRGIGAFPPSIIHQYNRFPSALKNIKYLCYRKKNYQ